MIDHLDLLHAFHDLSHKDGENSNSHRVFDQAAVQYEQWAQNVLPFQLQHRADRAGSRVCASAPMSRSNTSEGTDASPLILDPSPHSPTSPTYIPAGVMTDVCPSPTSYEPTSFSTPGSPASPGTPSSGSSGPTPTVSPQRAPFGRGASHVGHPHRQSTSDGYKELTAEELPPLSVLMCWHAHLLNPPQFAADTNRGTYAALKSVKFPLHAAAEAYRKHALPQRLPHIPESGKLRVIPSISGWTVADISAAVQRQSKIIDSVSALGWFRTDFSHNIAPIQRAIVRYHAWLDLVAHVGNHAHLVPDIDIELVWRTHELKGERYRKETEKLFGEPFDERISRMDTVGIKRTAHLWKERFNKEYLLHPPKNHHAPNPVRRTTMPW